MSETRTCQNCLAHPGERVSAAFTSLEGKHYPEIRGACLTCGGSVQIPAPDTAAILDAVKGRPKAGRQTLRSSRPADARSYYVWRWARFHGGADVTLPMCASLGLRRDPWLPELDMLAEGLALAVYGNDMAGAHRWGRALGHIGRDVPGLPASAYSAGPVADADKPDEEQPELF